MTEEEKGMLTPRTAWHVSAQKRRCRICSHSFGQSESHGPMQLQGAGGGVHPHRGAEGGGELERQRAALNTPFRGYFKLVWSYLTDLPRLKQL